MSSVAPQHVAEAGGGAASGWKRAAELAVPWITVRDELRGQIHHPEDEKDTAPATAGEASELQRRRLAAEHRMSTQVPQELDVMRRAVPDLSDASTAPDGVRGLLRAATFAHLNAEDHTGSSVPGEVWVADVVDPDVSRRFFSLSSPADRIDYFVSHSWDDDGNAKGMSDFGPTAGNDGATSEFGWRKSVAFGNVVRTIKEMTGADRNALSFWNDKMCVPQFDVELKTACIHSFDGFISASQGLVVLLTPRYIRRLWCVYELCCFLSVKPMSNVFVNLRSFASADNRDVYFAAIREFTVDGCECKVEFDRRVLREKVRKHYVGDEEFVRFTQTTIISLAIRDFFAYPPMIKTPELFAEVAAPWVELLRDLKFDALHTAWAAFDVPSTYASVEYDDVKYTELLQRHLAETVYPELDRERTHACRPDTLSN